MILVTGGSNQGKKSYIEKHFPGEATIINYEEYIADYIKKGLDSIEQTEKLLVDAPNIIVSISEMGSGIIPMEKADRIWRDTVGKTGCYLAQEAKEVYRVIAGIGMRIK